MGSADTVWSVGMVWSNGEVWSDSTILWLMWADDHTSVWSRVKYGSGGKVWFQLINNGFRR